MGRFNKLVIPAVAIAIFAILYGPLFGNLSNDMSETIHIDGLSFPTDIKSAGAKQILLGGGTRSKWGFKVYAVGIYSDLKIIKSLKKKYGNDSSSKINKQLSRDFSDSKQARTLLLRFHREVAASDIAEALGDALVNKVGKDTSNKFSAFMLDMVGGDKLKKGSDLYITCKGDKLWSSLSGGTDAKTISIKGLGSAIFDVYLGKSPVSQQAKEGFEQGFTDLMV